MSNAKISIRFFNDREVRAVWDEANTKWWFSVLDIVGILNEENDYTKIRNYWKYLKTKLKKENIELVSGTNQLKLLATDGKKYKKLNAISKATATRDLTELTEKYKILKRSGEIGAGTYYVLIGS